MALPSFSNKLKWKSKFLGIVGLLSLIAISFVFYVSGDTDKNGHTSWPAQVKLSNSTSPDMSFLEQHLSELKEDDPQLIQYTRFRHLTPPSKLPYNLNESWAGDKPDTFSSWVANFFGYKRGGTFLEAGAHEGEDASHSLYLEKTLGWTGLLVECNPNLVPILKKKHRKAWVADVCLAVTKTPQKVNFSIPVKWTYSGRIGPTNLLKENPGDKWQFLDVQTIPLYTLLAALGWKDVDYFSFDIEGQELNVLKLFPFDKVRFRVINIEVLFYTEDQRLKLRDFMKGKDYFFVGRQERDHIYVHKDFKHMVSYYVSVGGYRLN